MSRSTLIRAEARLVVAARGDAHSGRLRPDGPFTMHRARVAGCQPPRTRATYGPRRCLEGAGS